MNYRVFDDNYEDIINLPHHVSEKRTPMSMSARAAQFSPFSALTGYDKAVEETARLTCQRMELDESRKAVLNEKLQWILEHLEKRFEVTFTFFKPDSRKSGGEYIEITGIVKKMDSIEHSVRLMDGTEIPMEEIYEIEGSCFREEL